MTTDFARSAGPSATVAAWTLVSRGTGLLRALVVAAVLGPTYFANLFQAGNLVPNLTYEFLAGSLIASILVPALVQHLDPGRRPDAERVASGFLTVAVLAFAVVAGLLAALAPTVVRVLSAGVEDPGVVAQQVAAGRVLVALLFPQVAFYAVVGCAVAAQNAAGRFALPAAAPAAENVVIVVVLLCSGLVFGTGLETSEVSDAQLVWLGAGTTGAVAVHALVQWAGAARAGLVLRPRRGWRDDEVRALLRMLVPSSGYASLNAFRTGAAIVVAASLPGGVVAFQLALNFYFLPSALGGRSVSQAVLPVLARHVAKGDVKAYRDDAVRAVALTVFLVLPAAVGLLVLAGPLASLVAFGEMDDDRGRALLTAAVAGLALGCLGDAVFVLSTHARYAVRDLGGPLRAAATRTTVSVLGMVVAVQLEGPVVLLALGLAMAAGDAVAAVLLGARLARADRPGVRGTPAVAGAAGAAEGAAAGGPHLLPRLLRSAAAAASMALVSSTMLWLLPWEGAGSERGSSLLAVLLAGGVGLVCYVMVQRCSGAEETGVVARMLSRR